ncbi:hypothetical protein BCY91_13990 [Pelobium manganitolerans]|uniref:Uncharacterized protein n=1 Tax=Pelobium manganitolerans TaxID=1842495 RepID=A0A419S9V6_9SPHI|nr:hypothetical protein [Pelobium manganitolerans]RKD18983.1 hypothetical protein BCY91_13990 [Pelobium manganitolerans]
MRKLAPGAVHFTAKPDADVWKPDYETPEELMIATMQWKLDVVLKKKLPKHRMLSKFYKNKFKSC